MTSYKFTDYVKLSALVEKVAAAAINVSDEDYAKWIKVRHILIAFPQNENDQATKEAAAKAKIDDVAAKLKAGEDFAKLANEYSEDPGNTKTGVKQDGQPGWHSRGENIKELEDAAFALHAGEASEPVKTQVTGTTL